MTHRFPLAGLVLLVAAPAWTAPAVFTDPDFAHAWTVTTFVTGDGGTVEASLHTTDGAPRAPSRKVVNTVAAAPSPSEFSAVMGVHLDPLAVYDPQTQGPITSLDYHELAKLEQGFGDGHATGIALRQGDKTYVRYVGTTPAYEWVPKQELGIGAVGFARVLDGGADGNQHPDFSASGAPITFGFFRTNATAIGANGYTITALIDGWTVIVNTPCMQDADCAYADGCVTGTCAAGVCTAAFVVCDDTDACTVDGCAAGACYHDPVVCDDGDPCTTDACGATGCAATPIDCDDAVACTVDACVGGSCQHPTAYADVEQTLDAVIALLDAPPCGADGVAAPVRRRLARKLTGARAKLAAADAAAKARKIARLLGRADRFLVLVGRGIDRADTTGIVTDACAARLRDVVGDLRTCVADLPG